jgi:hypothetical protein
MWRTLHEVRGILVVVAIVPGCHFLMIKIRGSPVVFCVLLAGIFTYCRLSLSGGYNAIHTHYRDTRRSFKPTRLDKPRIEPLHCVTCETVGT